MISLFGFVQVILSPSGHDIFLMTQIVHQHVFDVHDLGLVIHQCKHCDAKGILKLRVFEELVQYDIGVCVVPELDDDSHTFAVRLIAQIGDSLDLLVFDKFGDLLDQVGLIDKIRKFGNHNTALAVVHGLDIRDSSCHYFAASGSICFLRARSSHYDTAGGKIRCLYNRQDLFNIGIPVLFNAVIDDLHHCCHNFS